LELLRSERYLSADWDDLAPMLATFLGAGQPTPAAACLAVAGPVEAGQAQLTNLHWQLDGSQLAAATGIGRFELVNDFAVLIYGLPHLTSQQQAPIRPGGGEAGGAPAGTGCGNGSGSGLRGTNPDWAGGYG
jgi:Glucokinase